MRDPEDYKLADLYDRNVLNEETVEELFAPGQRGEKKGVMSQSWGKVKDMAGGALNAVTGGALGKESASRNKLTSKYQEVWSEYDKYISDQKGMGAKIDYGQPSAETFLKAIGVPDTVLTGLKAKPNKSFGGTDKRRAAGNYIYAALGAFYQVSSPVTDYQISPTL